MSMTTISGGTPNRTGSQLQPSPPETDQVTTAFDDVPVGIALAERQRHDRAS